MDIIKDIERMRLRSLHLRKERGRLALVPTMGALHEGHLSLVDIAKKNSDAVVMSIYVNPKQFGPSEDLSNYPSNLERDLELAKSRGVDLLFCPSNETIYPEGFQTFVEVSELGKSLCGASRPGHFRGVTTVVAKLFNIVKPDVAVFGEKDYQQLKIIEWMVTDLNLDITIIPGPIVRKEDGLAMSSRNAYLSPEERRAARSIFEALKKARELVKKGENNIPKIVENIRSSIEATKIGRIDYIKICDPETLEELSVLKTPARLLIAAHFGKARLIDNCLLTY